MLTPPRSGSTSVTNSASPLLNSWLMPELTVGSNCPLACSVCFLTLSYAAGGKTTSLCLWQSPGTDTVSSKLGKINQQAEEIKIEIRLLKIEFRITTPLPVINNEKTTKKERKQTNEQTNKKRAQKRDAPKPDVERHTWIPSIDSRGRVIGSSRSPLTTSKPQATLVYMRPCLKKRSRKRRNFHTSKRRGNKSN